MPPSPPGTISPTDLPTTSPILPPGTGICSDNSGTCTAIDQCLCHTPARKLLGHNLHGTGQPFYDRKLQTASKLIISGVIDGPLTGGLPKMVELYVLDDIADLSTYYGVGTANNGGGTDGEEFTLSG